MGFAHAYIGAVANARADAVKFQTQIASAGYDYCRRALGNSVLPQGLVEAPKRPLQTPQREWLRAELSDWAHTCIEGALTAFGGLWLDRKTVQKEWESYCAGFSDNIFYIWQWINLALWEKSSCRRAPDGISNAQASGMYPASA